MISILLCWDGLSLVSYSQMNHDLQQEFFIFFYSKVHTGSWAQLYCHTMGKGAFNTDLKRSETEANHLSSLRAEFKNAWSRNYTISYNFMACRDTSYFLRTRLNIFSGPMLLVWIWRLFSMLPDSSFRAVRRILRLQPRWRWWRPCYERASGFLHCSASIYCMRTRKLDVWIDT